MLSSPIQRGDAVLGQLCSAFVHVAEIAIPNLHKLLSWESGSSDLGPILPVRGTIKDSFLDKSMCIDFGRADEPLVLCALARN